MNRTPDVELVLREYLADDGVPAPDHVLDLIEERISRQRQRRSWRLPWRNPMSSSVVKLAAGLAAVLILAVVAWQLLPGSGGPGGEPTASPSPPVVPSGSPKAILPDWLSAGGPPCDPNCAGVLSAGTHTSRFFLPAVTYSVPAGWINGSDFDFGYDLFPNTLSNEEEFGRSHDVDQSIFISATDGWADDWGICPGTYTWGDALTAANVTAALTASKNLVVTTPVPVTIGSLTGQLLDVRLSPSWTGTCPLDPEDPRDKDFKDIRLRLVVLDVPDGTDVVPVSILSLHAAEFDAFVTDAMPIVESLSFDFGPVAS